MADHGVKSVRRIPTLRSPRWQVECTCGVFRNSSDRGKALFNHARHAKEAQS